jgi:hypothetical protein
MAGFGFKSRVAGAKLQTGARPGTKPHGMRTVDNTHTDEDEYGKT